MVWVLLAGELLVRTVQVQAVGLEPLVPLGWQVQQLEEPVSGWRARE